MSSTAASPTPPIPLVRRLAITLRDEARAGGPAGQLFVDAVATTLSLHLLRRYSNHAPAAPRTGGLTGARLRAVTEHIDTHLGDNLRLEQLAELAGSDLPIADIAHMVGMSSQSHLTTVFRKLVGDTPAAYRRARRR